MKQKVLKKIKGFTLVELLAAIIILAVILLIVVPNVVTAIEDARKNTFTKSAKGLVNVVERQYTSDLRAGVNPAGEYIFTNGEIVSDKTLDFSGKKPNNGRVIVRADGSSAMAVHDGVWCVMRGFNRQDFVRIKQGYEHCNVFDDPADVVVTTPEALCLINNTCDRFEIPEGYTSADVGNVIPIASKADLEAIDQTTEHVFATGTIFEKTVAAGDRMNRTYLMVSNVDLLGSFSSLGYYVDAADKRAFEGKFNGNGYTISNGVINEPANEGVGIFAASINATIHNVNIENLSVTGYRFVGGLSGISQLDNMNNIKFNGTVQGEIHTGGIIGSLAYFTTLSNSFVQGEIIGTNIVAGGIIGYNNGGTLLDSISEATVTSPGRAGGAVGDCLNNCIVENVEARGDVNGGYISGGFAASSTSGSEIRNSKAIGNVTGFGPTMYGLGGFIGMIADAKVIDSYSTGKVFVDKPSLTTQLVGGFSGTVQENGESINNYTTGDVEIIADNIQWTGGFNGGLANTGGTILNSYAKNNIILRPTTLVHLAAGFSATNASGNVSNSHFEGDLTISSSTGGADYVGVFIGSIQEGATTLNSYSKGNLNVDTVTLRYAGGFSGLVSISNVENNYFSGNLRIKTSGNGERIGGFAGNVGSGANISDTHAIADVDIETGSGLGYSGFAGVLLGSPLTVDNSYSKGTLNVKSNTGQISGGFAGHLQGGSVITNSHTNVNIFSNAPRTGGFIGNSNNGSLSNSYATGNVIGVDEVGGFAGRLEGGSTLSNSYSTGNATGQNFVGGLVGDVAVATITNSHSTGSVIGDEKIGGFAGVSHHGSLISESHSTGNAEGNFSVGGFVGSLEIGASITRAYATGNVNGGNEIGGFCGTAFYEANITDSYSTGSVMGGNYVGGFIGLSTTSDMAEPDSGTTISRVYSTGNVSGNDYVGGLIGSLYNVEGLSTVSNAYALNNSITRLSGSSTNFGRFAGFKTASFTQLSNNYANQNIVFNGITKTLDKGTNTLDGADITLVDAKKQATYTLNGWDFTNIWQINENVSFPTLKF